MKKLKTWQFVLLIIFYPVGIFYFIYWLINKNKKPTQSQGVKIDSSKLEIIRDFHSKVVGVTFKNTDGSDRQEIIKSCKIGDSLILKPTPTTEYPNSIGVFTMNGRQLGNVNANLAEELINNYPQNPMEFSICNITGGGEDYNYGCNVHIIIYKQPN